MQQFRKTLLASLLGLALGAAGTSQAGFSFGDSNFSFGDDDDWRGPGWGHPYWGAPYPAAPAWGPGTGPMQAPPAYPYYLPPRRLNSYDRTMMRLRRQRQMDNHNDAMEELGDMLYGRYIFDREEAIKLAREIEASAGDALIHNFHPGSIAQDGSHATPAFWGNEKTFKANADALKTAAAALAEELEKRPGKDEGPVYPKRSSDDDPISKEIWSRYNAVASTCRACHATFRGPEW
jgi:cytochrome c556